MAGARARGDRGATSFFSSRSRWGMFRAKPAFLAMVPSWNLFHDQGPLVASWTSIASSPSLTKLGVPTRTPPPTRNDRRTDGDTASGLGGDETSGLFGVVVEGALLGYGFRPTSRRIVAAGGFSCVLLCRFLPVPGPGFSTGCQRSATRTGMAEEPRRRHPPACGVW